MLLSNKFKKGKIKGKEKAKNYKNKKLATA